MAKISLFENEYGYAEKAERKGDTERETKQVSKGRKMSTHGRGRRE